MKWHRLSGRQYLKAVGVGIVTSLVLSAIMVAAFKTGVSPLPAPVSLVFAQTLLGLKLPLPVGLLFHVAWVTFWSVFYVVFFWQRLSLRRAAGLAATEDVVCMLEAMGIDTGIDLGRLIEAVWLLEEMIGRPAPSRVSKTGPMPTGDDLYDPNLPLVETLQEARHFRLGDAAFSREIRPWREPIPAPDLREPAAT